MGRRRSRSTRTGPSPAGPIRVARATPLGTSGRLLAALFVFAAAASSCESAPALPRPEPVARAYAAAWERGEYQAMWALLTEESRERAGEEGFVKRLPRIAEEMSLRSLEAKAGVAAYAKLPSGSPDPGLATIPLSVVFRTEKVGEVARQTALRLVLASEQGREAWRIDWTPEAILPGLTPGRLVRMTRLPTSRGRIVARDGTELATFVEAAVVGVVPGEIRSEVGMLASLSAVIGLSPDAIRAKYTQPWVRPDTFVAVRTLAAAAAAAARPKLALMEGVQTRPQRVRSYPTGLAAQTIGYLGEASEEDARKRAARGVEAGDLMGRTGLEAALDEFLGGSYGWRLAIVEPNERPVETLGERAPVAGLDAVLALDPALQRAAETALGDQRGAVVAEDPWTGEIHALASRPSFDPNLFVAQDASAIAKLNADPRRPVFNRATFGQYATGSAFKLVTAAAALKHGLFRAGDRLDCPFRWTGYGPAWAQINHESADLGLIDLRTAMARSCNTFFYELGKRLNDRSPDLLPNEAKSFGLGKPTDIEFVLEAEGVVPSPAWKAQRFANDPANRGWNPGDATNLAIGQGFLLVTPLQMANYVAAVANDGIVWRPRLVIALQDRAGTVARPFPKVELGHADTKPTDLSLIRDGMRAVVADPDGTAYFPFRSFPVPVAGKSGTAETTAGAPHAWFIGFAPFDAPRLAIATVFEETPGPAGSQDAANASRAVFAAKFGRP